MAKKTLNTGNLETLGATRLAELLMEVSEGNAVAKRRLRLALAGAESSPPRLPNKSGNVLATIARSRSFVGLAEPEIAGRRSGNAAPGNCRSGGAALAGRSIWTSMWRFRIWRSRCSPDAMTVVGRSSKSFIQRRLTDSWRYRAISQAGYLRNSGDQVFGALRRNDYGQFDDLIQALQPALGPIGLEHLKQRMIALSAEPVRKPAANERQVIGWSPEERSMLTR